MKLIRNKTVSVINKDGGRRGKSYNNGGKAKKSAKRLRRSGRREQ